MSIVDSEPVKGFVRKIFPTGILPPPYDAIEEYVDFGLEQSNSKRAENIASTVRLKGKRRFGPMWAEYKGILLDGREVFLQASDDAFIVNISGTGEPALNEHAVWNRKQKIVNTFDQRDPAYDNKAIMYYQIAPQSERIPATLSRFEVSRRFASMLGQIEQINL